MTTFCAYYLKTEIKFIQNTNKKNKQKIVPSLFPFVQKREHHLFLFSHNKARKLRLRLVIVLLSESLGNSSKEKNFIFDVSLFSTNAPDRI